MLDYYVVTPNGRSVKLAIEVKDDEVIMRTQTGKSAELRFDPGDFEKQWPREIWVPEVFRPPSLIDKSWFDEFLPPLDFGKHGVKVPYTSQEIDALFRPFKLLQRGKSCWETAVYDRVDAKLQQHPQNAARFDLAQFGNKLSADIGWEIESVRLIYDEEKMDRFSAVPAASPSEPFLAFHGTQLSNLRPIVQNNFKVDGHGGWYGNGAYFTSSLVYAQHYIGGMSRDRFGGALQEMEFGFAVPKVGNVVYVLGVMIKPGSCFVIPKDTTPKDQGYVGPHRDGPKADGYDSHKAFVSPKSESNPAAIGLRPVAEGEDFFGMEFVIFDKDRVLPRYIIGLKRTK